MELQTKNNQGIAQRDTVAKFVNDVADMEIRAFSMREAAKKCRSDAERLENDFKLGSQKLKDGVGISKSARASTESELKEKKQKYAESERHCDNYTFADYCKQTFSGGRLFGFFFLHFGAIMMGIFSTPMAKAGDYYDESIVVITLIGLAFEIIFPIVWYVKKNAGYQNSLNFKKRDLENQAKEIKKLEEDLQKINKTIRGAELILEREDEAFAPIKSRADQIRQKADELDSAATFVEEKIKECYALNVIKPAYQKMVCVTILNDVFVNDKADTMREAMLLCDAEIRHSELIHQLDKVIHSLNILANNLQSIQDVLKTINANVSMISQDIFRLSESQEKMAGLIENIEGNSKAVAYATESIKQSADNADFYIAQRRAGVI